MLALALCLFQDSAAITRDIENANSTLRPQLQPQAVARLKERGGPAVSEAIVQYVAKKGHYTLSFAFTEALGSLKDEKIQQLLRELASDLTFPGRLVAIRALVEQGDRKLLVDFRAGLAHKSPYVRAGMLDALAAMGDRDSIPKIRALLDDDSSDVRAQAAKALHAMGDDSGLPVLVAALGLEAQWFDVDYGQTAREQAWNFLKTLTRDDFGYKPWESPEQRSAGRKRFESWMAGKDSSWRDKVPPKARAQERPVEWLFGYEAMSCKVGTFFFRIDGDWNLVVGNLNLVRVKLKDKEIERFKKAIERAKELDRNVLYGDYGCDFEKYHLKIGVDFDVLRIGLDGRPPALEPLIKLAREVVDSNFDPDLKEDFRDLVPLFRKAD